MHSNFLFASSIVSAITAIAHSSIGLEIGPELQSLHSDAGNFGYNGWWQISGYFLLNAVQQAKWAKYGLVTKYDKVMFWGLFMLYFIAGVGYAMLGIQAPQIAFFINVALMLASRLF